MKWAVSIKGKKCRTCTDWEMNYTSLNSDLYVTNRYTETQAHSFLWRQPFFNVFFCKSWLYFILFRSPRESMMWWRHVQMISMVLTYLLTPSWKNNIQGFASCKEPWRPWLNCQGAIQMTRKVSTLLTTSSTRRCWRGSCKHKMQFWLLYP